jgi:hypothetical protein
MPEHVSPVKQEQKLYPPPPIMRKSGKGNITSNMFNRKEHKTTVLKFKHYIYSYYNYAL